MDRHFRLARHWSNVQLKKYSADFSGEIVDVSAYRDEDKEGEYYRNYFNNAQKYYLTNYGGTHGESGSEDEIKLDLVKDLPEDLRRRFDVCFNHTTLEHVFDINKAFDNICEMAREAVILVVPWVQQVHTCDSFKDYWRISPYAVEKMFERNGFTMVVCDYNNDFNAATYLLCIGIRNECMDKFEKYHKVDLEKIETVGGWIGTNKRLLRKLLKKFK